MNIEKNRVGGYYANNILKRKKSCRIQKTHCM